MSTLSSPTPKNCGHHMPTMLDDLAHLSLRSSDFISCHLYSTNDRVRPVIEFVCDDLHDFFSLHNQLLAEIVERQNKHGHPVQAPTMYASNDGTSVEIEVMGVKVRMTCMQRLATPNHGDLSAAEIINMPFLTYSAIVHDRYQG